MRLLELHLPGLTDEEGVEAVVSVDIAPRKAMEGPSNNYTRINNVVNRFSPNTRLPYQVRIELTTPTLYTQTLKVLVLVA